MNGRMKRCPTVLVLAAIALMAGFARSATAGPPNWVAVSGAMSQPQVLPVTATLPDGRVLVIGGVSAFSSGSPISTVNVYDSATKAWDAPAASMTQTRNYPAVAVLPNGDVLAAGGIGSASSSAEIYDPSTNTWTATANMLEPVAAAAAVTLNNGQVLVIGGLVPSTFSATANTQLFNPSTGQWTPGPPLTTARYFASATLLPNGKVLVSGGFATTNNLALNSAELYDPTANAWSPAGQMPDARGIAITALLPDGDVITAGGASSAVLSSATDLLTSADVYDPATNQWQATGPMSAPHTLGGGGVVAGGRFVIAGGIIGFDASGNFLVGSSAEAYDPGTNAWVALPNTITPFAYGADAVVNGQLLLAGGLNSATGLSTSGQVYSGVNLPPVAVASAPAKVQGVAGSEAAVTVSAVGSTDPDHDPLTFVWSEGSTTLATTVDPVETATVGLGVGTHTLTLTVSDGYGGVATATVVVTVVDATAGLQAQVTQLTAQVQSLSAQLASAEQTVGNAVAAVQNMLRTVSRNASFVVPGATPDAQLQAVIQGVLHLKRECQRRLYELLNPPHHGHRHDRDDHDHDGRSHHHRH